MNADIYSFFFLLFSLFLTLFHVFISSLFCSLFFFFFFFFFFGFLVCLLMLLGYGTHDHSHTPLFFFLCTCTTLASESQFAARSHKWRDSVLFSFRIEIIQWKSFASPFAAHEISAHQRICEKNVWSLKYWKSIGSTWIPPSNILSLQFFQINFYSIADSSKLLLEVSRKEFVSWTRQFFTFLRYAFRHR